MTAQLPSCTVTWICRRYRTARARLLVVTASKIRQLTDVSG
jgi:hypothetical protein